MIVFSICCFLFCQRFFHFHAHLWRVVPSINIDEKNADDFFTNEFEISTRVFEFWTNVSIYFDVWMCSVPCLTKVSFWKLRKWIGWTIVPRVFFNFFFLNFKIQIRENEVLIHTKNCLSCGTWLICLKKKRTKACRELWLYCCEFCLCSDKKSENTMPKRCKVQMTEIFLSFENAKIVHEN